MSDERFDRIEHQLNSISQQVAGLADGLATNNTRLDDVAHGLEAANTRLDGLAEGLATNNARLDDVAHGLEAANTRLGVLATGQDDLRRQMLVLHEDAIDRIQALAPDFSPIRREFAAADRRLKEDIERRLDPLEAAFRYRKKPD